MSSARNVPCVLPQANPSPQRNEPKIVGSRYLECHIGSSKLSSMLKNDRLQMGKLSEAALRVQNADSVREVVMTEVLSQVVRLTSPRMEWELPNLSSFRRKSHRHASLVGTAKPEFRAKNPPQSNLSIETLRCAPTSHSNNLTSVNEFRHGRQDPTRAFRAPKLPVLQYRRRARSVRMN